jgi:ABC-type dipeptide/oligopeptide/nickel transport system permease component
VTGAIVRRLCWSLGVVFGAVTLIFAVLNWLPGDSATLVAGTEASAQSVEHVRAQLGLTRSIAEQYRDYVVGLLHGDLGTSYVTRQPVLQRLLGQFPATLALTSAASVVAVVLGIGLGVISALHQGRWLDQVIQALALAIVSVPSFWLGILSILLFSVTLGWLPVLDEGTWRPSVLPIACLGLLGAVPLLRMVREGLGDTLREPYVMTLRAKGLSERRLFFVHALRNALIPTVSLLSVLVGELLSGAVIVETLFARQGVGRLTVEAIAQKDLPMVQGAILLASVGYVLVNLFVDVAIVAIDPRTRVQARRAS